VLGNAGPGAKGRAVWAVLGRRGIQEQKSKARAGLKFPDGVTKYRAKLKLPVASEGQKKKGPHGKSIGG